VLKEKLLWFVAAAVILLALYLAVGMIGRRHKAAQAPESGTP
jgi:hypothetical protein